MNLASKALWNAPARDLEAPQAQQLGLTYVLLNGMAFSTFQYSTLKSAGPERRVPYQQEGSTPRKAEHGPRHIQRAVESHHARTLKCHIYGKQLTQHLVNVGGTECRQCVCVCVCVCCARNRLRIQTHLQQ